jgi:hypothetical protein
MSKAYLTPSKAIRLANGARLTNGQLIIGGNDMQNIQRRLNSSTPEGIAREGAAKKVATPQPVAGHKSQVKGDVHPWLHGQTLDDEKSRALPQKSHTKPTGYHTGTTDKQIIADMSSATASEVLHDARRLGRDKA